MGRLSIVATPIGNLQDITLRALETLKAADLILCEDTRVTKKLLDHFGIQKPLVSYHHHSTPRAVKEIHSQLEGGKHFALVTDAGTPGISDPGNELISVIARSEARTTTVSRSLGKQSHWAGTGSMSTISSEEEGEIASSPDSGRVSRNDIQIVPIPGPSAAIAALSISGFPTDKFLFLGFPPHKNKRKQFFEMVAESKHTSVFFESGHRILKCLGELKEILAPTRRLVVCRELTKMFETTYRGTAAELVELMKDARGEFVVVVEAK